MNNKLTTIFEKTLLNEPGDEMHACVKKTGRKVLTISTNNGKNKYSMTMYPNGTSVETISKKL